MMRRSLSMGAVVRVLPAVACAVWMALTTSPALSAPPVVTDLSIRGLQIGGTTTIAVTGNNLLPNPQVLLPVAIAEQRVKPGATAKRCEIEITLAGDVAGGFYQLWIANSRGVAAPVGVAIDHLPNAPFASRVPELPVALGGMVQRSDILRTTLKGRRRQRLVVETEAARLGSKLEPVIRLYDEHETQVAWAQRSATLSGDARMVVTLPADGIYTIELHDALYRAAAGSFFRLKVGDLPFADLVFPIGVSRPTRASLEYLSTNVDDNLKAVFGSFETADFVPAPWPHGTHLTGPRPRIVMGDAPELLEQPSGAKPQSLPVPAAVNGRLNVEAEVDRYRLAVKAGQNLRFDLLAGRVGSSLDGVLTVTDEKGRRLAGNDDRPGTSDPGLDYKVPNGVDSIVVAVSDLQDRGGSDFVYRLAVDLIDRADYSLSLTSSRQQLPSGGVALLRVHADRRRYNGPIRLAFRDLPPGIAVRGNVIPAGATDALVTLIAPESAPVQLLTRLDGEAAAAGTTLWRPALAPQTELSKCQPWLQQELALAVTEPSPIDVRWAQSSGEEKLLLGQGLPTRVEIRRAEGTQGEVRLALLSSQVTPKKKATSPTNPRAQIDVDDPERSLRLDGQPTIAGDASNTTAKLLVPADLPRITYDLAIQAELLSTDGKRVLATAVTPARRMTVAAPFSLQLAESTSVEAPAGIGEPGRLIGKLRRAAGFDLPVTVTLGGLSNDLPVPKVVVPAGKDDFSLALAFPFGSKAGPLENVKLLGTAHFDRGKEAPDVDVTGETVAVALRIVPGEAPPALNRIFDDEASFVRSLTEGDGRAALERIDRVSGNSALRVTAGRAAATRPAGLGVHVREKPGPGEYRYLRFAWKTQGDAGAMVELHANGAWGPKADEKEKPAYRYQAGGADEKLGLAAVTLDGQPSVGWQVVTRDLFADFGEFRLDGLGLRPTIGNRALFDHVYLARTREDFESCPALIEPSPPLALFEDESAILTSLSNGNGTATLTSEDRYSGDSSVQVTPDLRSNPGLANVGVRIRANPGPGEYRYVQFAWKKQGGAHICMQLAHDGAFGPTTEGGPSFRYDASAEEAASYGSAVRVGRKLPDGWVLVTRDLVADFGEFTMTGLALCPMDGEFGLFDHIYLGSSPRDFELVAP